MICSGCGQDNPSQARFCMTCAARLTLSCSGCGTELPPVAAFCFACGRPATTSPVVSGPMLSRTASPVGYTPRHLAEKILDSRSALEGERKQVTVLFADLKSSMELLADRDPEEARQLLDPVLRLMMDAVHRYEGTVNQIMGDGIMALFGAPLAHEDHAVRACYAALAMQAAIRHHAVELRRSHGIEIQIRVGLNSGEVVVRAIGSDLRMDYSAIGQTTHLAARMEQIALGGTIRLTADTLRLAEGFVQVTPLGPIPVKGLTDPVEVFELTGAGASRSRLQAAAARGLTRFVGRESEMAALRQALERVRAGHGQVVALVGEPGVGKSRLVWELTHSHRAQGWLVFEGGAVSYGKATSWLPVVDLLKGYFQVDDRDDVRRIREKVSGKLVTLDASLLQELPLFLALLDIPLDERDGPSLDPMLRRRRTLDAVRRLLLRESVVQPLLVVMEDLHWIDGETQAFLDSLVENLPGAQLLLLVNYRPEFGHGWGSKTYYTQLRLDALGPESAEALLHGLIGADPGLTPLTRLLIKRTQGNPLFIEECVRGLVETRALVGERGAYRFTTTPEKIQIPASVQALLAARIDRLPAEDKQLLQAAAVIGKDVPLQVLEAIAAAPPETVNDQLARLQAAELLYATSLFPEVEYTFKHALTHEVAYASLLSERRRALHGQIVDALERLPSARADEQVDRLAHHAFRAGTWEKALDYLRRSGDKAVARSAFREAASCFQQALEALAHLPESRAVKEQAIDLRLALRPALVWLGQYEETVRVMLEAEAIARQIDDRRRLGWVSAGLSLVFQLTDHDQEAKRFGENAVAIGEALADPALQSFAKGQLATICFNSADVAPAVRLAREALELLRSDLIQARLGLSSVPSVWIGHILARALAQLGDFETGSGHGRAAMEIAEGLAHPLSVVVASVGLGHLCNERGDFDQARPLLERSLVHCRDLELGFYRGAVSLYLGQAHARAGRGSDAVPLLEEALETITATAPFLRSFVWPALAEAYISVGRLDEARGHAERTLAWARERGHRGWEPVAHHLLGLAAARSDPPEVGTAERNYQTALAIGGEYGRRPLVARCHLGLGELYRKVGKREQAQEHLDIAIAMFSDMGMRFWYAQAEAERVRVGLG